MANSITLAVALALLCTASAHAQEPESSNIRTVERLLAAFNAHDSSAMGAFVTDDVAWLTITGEDVAVEVKGKSELLASMSAYFESCPTCQSALAGTLSTPGRVTAIEIARWQGETGARSQRSISVYEFSDGLIQRVYYFPSEN